MINVQRYFAYKKEFDNFVLEEYDTHHITKVMRLNIGDLIEVVYDSVCYECEIVGVSKNIMVKKIKEIQKQEKEFGEITLVIPVLKEFKMDLILQKATELGIDNIIPIRTERSVVKIDSKKEEKKLERWKSIVKEASEQSKRLTIPNISNIKDIKDLKNIDGDKIICSTREPKNNLKIFLQKHNKYDKMLLVVGPEGGFTLKEENAFIDNGFIPVTLGKNIMRVETVPLFCLSAIMYEFME